MVHSLDGPFGPVAHSVIPSRGFVGAGGGRLFRGLALPASVVFTFRLSVRSPFGEKGFVGGASFAVRVRQLDSYTLAHPLPQALFEHFSVKEYKETK